MSCRLIFGIALVLGIGAGMVSWMELNSSDATVEVTLDAEGTVVALYYPPEPTHAPDGEFYSVFSSGEHFLASWQEMQRIGVWPARYRWLAMTVSPEWVRQAQERQEVNTVLSYIGYDEDGGSI